MTDFKLPPPPSVVDNAAEFRESIDLPEPVFRELAGRGIHTRAALYRVLAHKQSGVIKMFEHHGLLWSEILEELDDVPAEERYDPDFKPRGLGGLSPSQKEDET